MEIFHTVDVMSCHVMSFFLAPKRKFGRGAGILSVLQKFELFWVFGPFFGNSAKSLKSTSSVIAAWELAMQFDIRW